MTQKRAVFLINSLAGGGAERVMCNLLAQSESERSEFAITLALLDQEPAAYSPPDWVEVRQLDARMSAMRSIIAVRQLYAELKPDVTLSFLTRSNIANVINARGACVISERAFPSQHLAGAAPGRTMARTMVRAFYPRASRVIAPSEGVAQDLRRNFGVRAGKLVVIPNPIDTDALHAKAALAQEVAIDGPYALAVGRLVPGKGYDLMIRAFAASGLPGKLVILGEGELREPLMEVARAAGMADRLVLPGFAKNPYPTIRGADLFLMASESEGFPNALIEAMALGRPVVAANCRSGPSEFLAERTPEEISGLTFAPHGVLTPVRDEALYVEALKSMADPERRRAYGEKAAARARVLTALPVKDRYWDVLRDAMRMENSRGS